MCIFIFQKKNTTSTVITNKLELLDWISLFVVHMETLDTDFFAECGPLQHNDDDP
jgi:hypothetical protein